MEQSGLLKTTLESSALSRLLAMEPLPSMIIPLALCFHTCLPSIQREMSGTAKGTQMLLVNITRSLKHLKIFLYSQLHAQRRPQQQRLRPARPAHLSQE
jgi:hypothetical protein